MADVVTPLTYRSPKTEVRASPIQGRGLFARTAIGCGEIVAVKGGYVLATEAWRALEPTLGPAEIQLTHDWATTDNGDYTLACRCGRPSCRGTITGKDWMKPELQAKYAGWFCWFLQRKIEGRS